MAKQPHPQATSPPPPPEKCTSPTVWPGNEASGGEGELLYGERHVSYGVPVLLLSESRMLWLLVSVPQSIPHMPKSHIKRFSLAQHTT